MQLSSFVGREKELAEVKRSLEDARLVTLGGPGGCGKTRLALEAATSLAEVFEDGVWLVELAPIPEPDLLPQTVASALGVSEQAGRSLTETLSGYLRIRRLLLLLDNCEHLIGACADLAEALLRSCPNLRILATSREALGISGERSLTVPSLSLPDPRRLQSSEELEHHEATRLFVERASATADFALTEDNVPAVARLCYQLDGIPLAIELAAARVKALSVEQISSRLDESLDLLRGGSRTADPRQRTLRSTIGWSYDLLVHQEQVLLRRLSVFNGGFALDAAEEVCSSEDLEKGEVLDLLARLVDKSLVLVAADQQDGEVRYRLLETVRQYGAEKLGESGQTTEIRRRHAGYFLSLSEKIERDTRRGTWLERLEREHGNLRLALGWALESGEAELGLRLAGALGVFWNMRGHVSEGHRWLEMALANGAEAPEPTRARALLQAGWLAREQGDYERSVALTEESLALARKLGDNASAVDALSNLGWTAFFRNELEKASESIEDAMVLQRALDDGPGLAHSLTVLAMVAVVRHDYERTMTLHEESLALAREAEDAVAITLSLMPGALASLGQGNYRQAWELCEEGLRISWRLKTMLATVSYLHMAAALAGSLGQPIRSARLWGAAESLLDSIGSTLAPVERRFYEPYVAAARSQLDDGAWQTARMEGRALAPEQAVDCALETSQAKKREAEEVAPVAGLTRRETEVLRLVAEGLTNPQVARKLFISPRTVNRHLNSVYHKLGVNSRAAATRVASRHQLL